MSAMRVMTGLAAVVLGASEARAQATPTFSDIPYGDGDVRQMLDIYLPTNPPPGPRPTVVWVHGGGWQNGDKLSAGNRAPLLLQAGYVVVGINYRYSFQAIFPAQIHDCKAAIRWVRANAGTYNIDPARIGVWGSSAGGHLVALLGTSAGVPDAEGTVGGNLNQSSRVQAVADYFGPTDFFNVEGWHSNCAGTSAEEALLGACLGDIQANQGNPEWAEEVARAHLAGSVTHVSPDDPPFYIAHGTADTTVWPEHSEILHGLLSAAGVNVSLHMVEGVGHFMPATEDQIVRAFFNAMLVTNPPLAACAGDANRDRVVNAADLSVVLGGFTGATPSGENGDLNGDAVIDGADLSVLLSNFGDGC
jgi:acetyl esterase/lipase